MSTKLLIHSNAPWAPTGYGCQTALFAPLLAEHYDVAISSFYGLEGARLRWQDIPVFPGLGNEYGLGLNEHARRFFGGDARGGLVFSLLDVWVLEPEKIAQLDMACWTPVDHDPAPPMVVNFFAKSGAIPVAMSRFGEERMRDRGLDPTYVPHGIDVDVYRPRDKREVRKLTGVPNDAFLVGMVAANKGRPSRKGFQQAFEAFRAFRENHDDALLYLHTMTSQDLSQGEDILGLLESLQIPAESVMVADQYKMLFNPYPAQTMSEIYSAMDVLLNPAMGEGFGIPVLEAAACGVPSIVTDFSAMPEVAGPAGWKVKCRGHWTGQKSWQAVADVQDIVDSLRHCYSLSNNGRKELGAQARRHALQYAAPKVLQDHLLPSLAEAEERLQDRRPVELKVAA